MITKNDIRNLLAKSDTMVIQSLCRLTNKQTEIEKGRRSSLDKNYRGFKKQHGCLVIYAEKVWIGETLSTVEIAFLRARLGVYAGQLARMANARQLSLFN